jgi:uncharacterized protein (TIGR00255 family)
MTGFASVGAEAATARVQVTMKSVNHRFLDVVVKAPQAWQGHDGRVRAVVGQRLARGRVEIALAVETTAAPPRDVVLDAALLEQVSARIAEARDRGLVTGTLTASDLLRIPQLLDIRAREPRDANDADVAPLIERAVADAADALVAMRETEGRHLAADLDARLATIAGFVDALETLSREGQSQLETRLRERLASLPPDVTGDAASVAQEIVRFVARSDVDEEVVRLRGHIDHWRELAAGPEPCGRKLDFLVQEMNREINTIGSKVEGPGATERVIAAKSELERIREQVQNVE